MARNIRPITTNELTSKIKIQLTTICINSTPLKLATGIHNITKGMKIHSSIIFGRILLWLVMYDHEKDMMVLSHQVIVAIC